MDRRTSKVSSQILQRNSYSGTFATLARGGNDDDVQFTEDAVEGIVAGIFRSGPSGESPFTNVGPDDRIARRSGAVLTEERRAELQRRLDRMDRGTAAPWTARALRLIASYPGVVSSALARRMGQERAAFKIDVRKLKELGLTESLEVGYQLSALGRAFVGRDNGVLDWSDVPGPDDARQDGSAAR